MFASIELVGIQTILNTLYWLILKISARNHFSTRVGVLWPVAHNLLYANRDNISSTLVRDETYFRSI